MTLFMDEVTGSSASGYMGNVAEIAQDNRG